MDWMTHLGNVAPELKQITFHTEQAVDWDRKRGLDYDELDDLEQISDRTEAHHWIDALEDKGYVIVKREQVNWPAVRTLAEGTE